MIIDNCSDMPDHLICLSRQLTSLIVTSNSTLFIVSDAQQCSQPTVSQPQQPTLDVPLPGESKEETIGGPHVRAGSASERSVDPVKIENIGGGTGRQASGPPGQGYSKYQKSLPPRFQRQQQVGVC